MPEAPRSPYPSSWNLGYNHKLNDIQAAISLTQLRKLQGFLEARRKVTDLYELGLEDLDGISPPVVGSRPHMADLRGDYGGR